MKTRIPMSTIYGMAADTLRNAGNRTPTHCDVRCTVNDILDGLDKDGHAVRFDYSQDRAFSDVRAMMRSTTR